VALETAQAGNVTCNAICPGYVLTDLIRNQLEDTAKARGIPKAKYHTPVHVWHHPVNLGVRVNRPQTLVLQLHFAGNQAPALKHVTFAAA